MVRMPASPAVALRALVCALLVAVLAALGAVSPARASAADPAPRAGDERLIVVGAPGLSIGDLSPDATPALWEFASRGSAANLSVRTLTPATCPVSGWLTLGAGERMRGIRLPAPEADSLTGAPVPLEGILVGGGEQGPANAPAGGRTAPEAGSPDDGSSPEPASGASDSASGSASPEPDPSSTALHPPLIGGGECPFFRSPVAVDADGEPLPLDSGAQGGRPGVIDYFSDVTEVNRSSGYGGVPGARTRSAEWCTEAIGPGAAYAAAGPGGAVEHYSLRGSAPGGCPLTLVDLGMLGERSWQAGVLDGSRSEQLADLDARFAELLESVDLAQTDVVVAGLADSSFPSRLRAVLAAGPSYEPGTLSSTSTRQPGIVQLTDLMPASLALADLPDPGEGGARFVLDPSSDPAADRLADLEAGAQKAATVHASAQTVGIVLDVVIAALILAASVLLTRRFLLAPSTQASRRAREARVTAGLARAGYWAATIPMGCLLAGLLPWSRLSPPGLGLGLSIALGAAALGAVGFAGPWRRTWAGRVGAVCLTAALVIVVDVALGSRLQFNSPIGYNAIVGGRFYGLGNQGAALYLVSAFLGIGLIGAHLVAAGRRRTLLVGVVLAGLVSVGVLGNPSWGAKFGGTIAALTGFIVLALVLLGIRLTLVRLVLVGAAALATIIGIAGLDYLRPAESRSHFGSFFGQLLSGELLEVIGRKLAANLNIVVINPAIAAIVPLAAFAVLCVLGYLRRFDRLARLAAPWRGRLPEALADDTVHAGFLAAAVGLGVGLVITDSGVAVPATGAMMLVPLLLCLCAGASASASGSAASASGPAAPPDGSADGRRDSDAEAGA